MQAITLQCPLHRQCRTPILGDGKAVGQPLMDAASCFSVEREIAAPFLSA